MTTHIKELGDLCRHTEALEDKPTTSAENARMNAVNIAMMIDVNIHRHAKDSQLAARSAELAQKAIMENAAIEGQQAYIDRLELSLERIRDFRLNVTRLAFAARQAAHRAESEIAAALLEAKK